MKRNLANRLCYALWLHPDRYANFGPYKDHPGIVQIDNLMAAFLLYVLAVVIAVFVGMAVIAHGSTVRP